MNRDTVVFVAGSIVASILLLASDRFFAAGLVASIAVFSALWLVSLVLRDASIVDIFWGPGFAGIGAFYALNLPGGPTLRGLVVLALVTIWGIRLGLYIGTRNAGSGEDSRYRQWREEAGPDFWWISYFKVFLLQAVILWIVSSPLLLAHGGDAGRSLGVFELLGTGLWLVGFLFESIADHQLLLFKRNPANRGQVMRKGLWGFSRHPNYFGETVLWWGIGLIAFPAGGWLSFLGPLLITFLLLRISGVTLLEKALVESRPGYAEYVRSTPAFFPWPRKSANIPPPSHDE